MPNQTTAQALPDEVLQTAIAAGADALVNLGALSMPTVNGGTGINLPAETIAQIVIDAAGPALFAAGRASVRGGAVENVPLRDILGSIDNALRNGSYMTGANFAMEMLCDLLEVERDGLTFTPDWYRRRQAVPGAGAGQP